MSVINASIHICNFCKKNEFQVLDMIAGPKVDICNECIELCVEIIEEKQAERNGKKNEKETR